MSNEENFYLNGMINKQNLVTGQMKILAKSLQKASIIQKLFFDMG